jgi:uncharacterized small protein (DUF1192 family)
VIENKPLAAKHNPMENTVTEKRVIALTASQRLSAITSGELEVDMDVDAEMSERIGAYAQEVQELTAKLDELKAVADAKAEADAAKVEAENLLAVERAALKAAADDIAALRAEIEHLKSQPIAPPVLAKGDDNVEPGAAPADAPAWKKITGEERARMVATRASSH